MTPGARIAAAIEVLDLILHGAAAEQQLTRWARAHRFAGSGDRAAIRDHVFDALRRKRSAAALGGAETGRGIMIGLLRAQGHDPAVLFNGQGHSPTPLSDDELAHQSAPTGNVALDCPEPVAPLLRDSLGQDFASVMQLMQSRAPVFLRVNAHLATRDQAQSVLAQDGIETVPSALSKMALEVIGNTRKIRSGQAFLSGLVEVQDAASQAVSDLVPVAPGGRVLDYCAGGGGKSLALAARGATVVAHDANPRRMTDLPTRAHRSKLEERISTVANINNKFETVLIDVPCSGTGAWRRNPDAKWRLTKADVDGYVATQRSILRDVAGYVAEGGVLAYATCSILNDENENQINGFLAESPEWRLDSSRVFSLLEGADGFFVALLSRRSA